MRPVLRLNRLYTPKTTCINVPRPTPTPRGIELVMGNECEEPTRVMSAQELKLLLEQAGPHTHHTVCMQAVKV